MSRVIEPPQAVAGRPDSELIGGCSERDEDLVSQMIAVHRSRICLDLALDGTILGANPNFLRLMGYTNDEIKGKHHDIFLELRERNSADNRDLWTRLLRGENQLVLGKRIGRNGKEVWLASNYNPNFAPDGRLYMIQVISTDNTERCIREAAAEGRIEAIRRAMNVFECDVEGRIQDVNENLVRLFGYSRDELIGKHYDVLVGAATRSTPEYKRRAASDWERLRRGEFLSGESKHQAKSGGEIWVQYSYNPILDPNGNVCSVLAFYTDITRRVTTDREVERIAGALAASSSTLEELSLKMSGHADAAAHRANEGTSGAEQANLSLEIVSSGTQQMIASIKEISRSATDAAAVASTAVHTAQSTSSVFKTLEESSGQIEHVVRVITTIASQTNLLALNAHIEAARAGEAGKGFGVVAQEVKQLARETATATEDISRRIEAIQNDSRQAIAAMAEIGRIIGKISDISSVIASAVEEQNATTHEMARSVNEAARNTAGIVKSTAAVAQEAQDTSKAATDTETAAHILAELATNLEGLIHRESNA